MKYYLAAPFGAAFFLRVTTPVMAVDMRMPHSGNVGLFDEK
tara:strand:+ start:175 stop:297 length:123 start_codon:yes stop_codon:yes gene_type:complete